MARFQSFDGTTIVYDDKGAGAPVLLVHGFAQDAFSSWVQPGLFDRLAGSGRRVIAPDNRGHGMSDRPHEPQAYADNAIARDVQALLDHLQIEQCDVVSYSMGAASTLRLLPRESRFRAAVLGGIGANADQERGSGGAGGGQNPLADAMLAEDARAITNPIAKSFRTYADRTGADRQALAAFISGSSIGRDAAGDLSAVEIPVLVLTGEGDPLAPNPDQLAAKFKNGTSRSVPGTHLNVLNNPAFQDAVVEFLQSVE